MKQQNVAKINLEVRQCRDCPFARLQEGYGEWFCIYDLKNPGMRVNEKTIPDWCPFVLERLQKAYDIMKNGTLTSMPRRWLNDIAKRQKDDPNPKFGADHAFGHVARVIRYGDEFLEECVGFGILSNNEIQKLKLLLRISAMLHDVGLADSVRNHDIHSAELAKKYFASGKVDLDEEDEKLIIHAILNHSKGHETRTFLDAALIMGDKLDVASERMMRVTDVIIAELMKVEKVEYRLHGQITKPEVAELKYITNGEEFDVSTLSHWSRSVLVPKMLSLDFLKVPEFKFFVDDREVDVSEIF